MFPIETIGYLYNDAGTGEDLIWEPLRAERAAKTAVSTSYALPASYA
jgi:hypothetical protein